MQHPVLPCVEPAMSTHVLPRCCAYILCLEHTVLPCFMALFFDQICICQENALELPYALEKKCFPK